jgi:hypothetical protein
MMIKRLYSCSEDHFEYDDIADAICDLFDNLSSVAFNNDDVFEVYAQDFKEVTISYFKGNILDSISDTMYEELGEESDCYVDLSILEIEEFNKMVSDWLDAHDKRKFYVAVGRMETIQLTKQDIIDVVGEDNVLSYKTVYGTLQY